MLSISGLMVEIIVAKPAAYRNTQISNQWNKIVWILPLGVKKFDGTIRQKNPVDVNKQNFKLH